MLNTEVKDSIIKRIAIRTLSWILLIQIVNISVDPADPFIEVLGIQPGGEDLSINDIESIYEFVSEQCLGVDIPEHDEEDENAFVKDMEFFCSPDQPIKIKTNYQENLIYFTAVSENPTSVTLDHTSPPPKA